MRILLDESIPAALGRRLEGHRVGTVPEEGWAGMKNGSLLAKAAADFDVLLTADKGMEYQQHLPSLPIGILIVRARSNRIDDIALHLPAILLALDRLIPRSLVRIGP